MRIRIQRATHHRCELLRAGEERDVPEMEARMLVDSGRAEHVNDVVEEQTHDGQAGDCH